MVAENSPSLAAVAECSVVQISIFLSCEVLFVSCILDQILDFDDDDEETISVNPEDLRFTQDSIAVCFQSPYEDYRIDQTVDMIVSKKLSPNSFPMLNVVRYKGNLWCLDNRRVWVFRKARVASITVSVDPSFETHQRFLDIKSNTSLMKRWSAKN